MDPSTCSIYPPGLRCLIPSVRDAWFSPNSHLPESLRIKLLPIVYRPKQSSNMDEIKIIKGIGPVVTNIVDFEPAVRRSNRVTSASAAVKRSWRLYTKDGCIGDRSIPMT